MEYFDCEIEGDNFDDWRDHQIEEEINQMLQVIEDLTGTDMSLMTPILSIPTLQRMIFDCGADASDEHIGAIVTEIRPNLDRDILKSRIHQAIEVVREVERMMVTR